MRSDLPSNSALELRKPAHDFRIPHFKHIYELRGIQMPYLSLNRRLTLEEKIIGSHGGATPASFGDEAPPPSGAFGCSTSKPPFPLSSETESRSPVRGQLVAYSCLSVHVHSLPPSAYPPQPPLRQKILHYRADLERKWSPLSVRGTFFVE